MTATAEGWLPMSTYMRMRDAGEILGYRTSVSNNSRGFHK